MLTKKKLAIVSTHPIQYYAPVFRALAGSELIDSRVFYTWSQTESGEVHDRGFGREIAWDVPLLDGYDYEFVSNISRQPGSDRFFGIRNPSLIGEIERWGADAVLIFGWNLHSHFQAMRYFHRRIPVFFRGDSTLINEHSALRSMLRRAVLRWVYSYVDVALAVGQNSYNYFCWCGISPQHVVTAPHSVANDRFADPTGTHASKALSWRKQLGIPQDAIVVLFAGKLISVKEPELLIDAFSSCTSGHLVIVGSGPLDVAIRERIAGHPRIHLLPFQNQAAMPAVYRIGDVFALPSKSETWGLALNEAMASARPVIASSRVGAARDLVREAENGWIFRSGDCGDLTRVLNHITSMHRESLRSMGMLAQQSIQDWSPQESARKIAASVEQRLFNSGKRATKKCARSALEVN